MLLQGAKGWAAIGADPGTDSGGVLAFGLIWLDYLRRREPRSTIRGLVIVVPAGRERPVCLRLRHLRQDAGRFEVLTYSEDGFSTRVDTADQGNLDTRLEPARGLAGATRDWSERLGGLPGVETIPQRDGNLSFRVRGLEFARTRGGQLLFGAGHFGPRFRVAPEGDRGTRRRTGPHAPPARA